MRLLILTLLLASAPLIAGTPLPESPHVVATGEGKVTVAPDLATITLQTRHRDASAATAKQAADSDVEALLAAAPGFDMPPADITASDLSLSEDFHFDEQDRRISNGWVASREVRAKLRDLSRLSEFLDAAIAAGIPNVESIELESARAEALRLQARKKAVDDARGKAGDLASAFGASLGPVYSINSLNSESGHGYGGTMQRIEVTGTRVGAPRYLQPTVDYSERVTAVFELKR